jgi:hypothetical protein
VEATACRTPRWQEPEGSRASLSVSGVWAWVGFLSQTGLFDWHAHAADHHGRRAITQQGGGEPRACANPLAPTRPSGRTLDGFDPNAADQPPSQIRRRPDQYSPLITKNEPRMVPASFDFWRANLNREASSTGTSIPSESLNPTARFLASSTVYSTLIDRPLS